MSKKILVIDDDDAVLDIMKEALNYEGFEAVTSPVADNYKDLMRQHNIDLLVIDYLLKGVNGGEICHQIKCSAEFGYMPVIIYSAYPKVLLSLGDYGCDVFIPKPFDLAYMIGQISKLLYYSPHKIFAT